MQDYFSPPQVINHAPVVGAWTGVVPAVQAVPAVTAVADAEPAVETA